MSQLSHQGGDNVHHMNQFDEQGRRHGPPDKAANFLAYSKGLGITSYDRMRAIYQNIIDNNGHLLVGAYRF